MKRAQRMVLFAAAAIVQLSVPASIIVGREMTLRTGQWFKFKTTPVDPYDAFRGRFVAVRVEQNTAPRGMETDLSAGVMACAWVAADSNGFAVLSGASRRPPSDKPYIRAKIIGADSARLTFALPLDRFYMNERLAPAAEAAYRARAGGPRDAWLAVRVRNGRAVIEDLYLGDRKISEVLKANP